MAKTTKKRVKRITILFGSESDWLCVKSVLEGRYSPVCVKIVAHVISCHRNPEKLRKFAKRAKKSGHRKAMDCVICFGGMAFALPGVLDAWLYFYKKEIPVIGVAHGEPETKSLEAAVLSIEEIPGHRVLMNSGECYKGQDGLLQAIDRVVNSPLPSHQPRAKKPAKMRVYQNF